MFCWEGACSTLRPPRLAALGDAPSPFFATSASCCALGDVRRRDAFFSKRGFFKKSVPSRAHSKCPLLSVFWEVLKNVAGLVREHNSMSEGLCTVKGQKWRTGALWFWWPQTQSSGFKASQFQLLPGTSFCQLIVRINRKLVQVVRSVCAKRTQQVEQSWTMQQPLACQEAIGNMHGGVTILPAMG